MKPTFALNLSNERVGLLHRTGRGWLQVGEVAFDTPDLSEALAYLRRTALGLSPRGVTTKLVIPNSQILYCDVEAPGPDDAARRNQIRAGLAGRTPYAPDDLVFDWRGKGTMVKVAVIARETLAEAEAFATEHRFGPVSFVALPDASQFKGEPFFGVTEASKEILAKGETVEPDRDAMTIVTRDLPIADLPPEAEERPSKRSDRAEKPSSDPIADAVEKLKTSSVAAPEAPSLMAAPPSAAVDPVEPAPVRADVVPDGVPDTTTVKMAPPLPPKADSALQVAAMLVEEEAPFANVEDDAAILKTTVETSVDDDLPPAPSKAAQMAFASRRGVEELAKSPVADIRSERSFAELPGAARTDSGPKRQVPPLRNDAQVTAPSIPGSKKRKSAPTTPPPAVAAAAAALANASNGMGKPTKPLTRPGGTFGAKPLPRRGKPRYLGLILTGLLLVGLALVAAWYSSSMVTSDAAKRVKDTASAAATGTETVPAVDDEMLADQQDIATPSDSAGTTVATTVTDAIDMPQDTVPSDGNADVPVATDVLASADLPVPPDAAAAPVATAADVPQDDPAVAGQGSTEASALADAAPVVAPSVTADATTAADPATSDTLVADAPAAVAPEPAEPAPVEVAVAPDVGRDATGATPEPRQADVAPDEIFLATADTLPSFEDALKLPLPALTVDPAPAAAAPPPAFGTVYQFEPNGLIRPTEAGILAPDGYMLFAGAPPLTPPERSAAVLAAVAAAASSAAAPATTPAPLPGAAASLVAPVARPAPSDPSMAEFRPRPRPNTLATPNAAQTDDGARLSGDEETRVALLRPRPRPTSAASVVAPMANDASAASLTAQANAAVEAALASAAETGNIMTLAVSRRPAARPQDMSRAVNAAVAAAIRAPDPAPETEATSDLAANPSAPEADSEPELASNAAPKIPTKTNVAKQATFVNAINLSKINLIGVYGTPSKRYALVRLATGRYKKVTVGDSVDGGRVEAITASEVRYQKGGRLVSLKMPRA